MQKVTIVLNSFEIKADKLEVGQLVPVCVYLSHEVRNEVVKKDAYNAEIKNIEYKIHDITKLATNTNLNAKRNEVKYEIPCISNLPTIGTLNVKINEVQNKIPNITNLASTTALTAVENKILKISDLVKKADHDAEIKDIANKYFITSDYNKFMNIIFDAKITRKKLVNESSLNEKIKRLASKEEIKRLATKA